MEYENEGEGDNLILLLIVISQTKMWISWNLLWTLFWKINNVLPLLHHFQYGFDTSEFTYNPTEPNRLPQNAAPPTEDRSRCSIMWSLVVENFVLTDEQVMSATDSTCCLVKVAQCFSLVCSYVSVWWKVSDVLFSDSDTDELIPSSALRWWIHLAKFYEWKMLRMIFIYI